MNNANGGNILFHFKGDASQLNKTTSSLGGMTKSILVATGVTKALSTAWNMVASSTDSAIERYDQLNAFPKVMSSLGIETSKSEKAIKRLSEGLQGLPTTLNQGTQAVSRFVSKNGDVEKSTEMFLALNNAIIAGNAPAENQAAALEQMAQAYSKGKPDMMEWRSLLTAMPGQLKRVAKAMGYVSTDELYEALQKGEVSMDDFMNKIVELNNKGGDGLASFQEQAQNAVGGIGTAMTNMKTAVARGVANMITSLDTTLKKANIKGGISGIIGKIGEGFESGLKQLSVDLAPLIEGLITGEGLTESTENLTSKLMDGVSKAVQFVNDNMPELVMKIGDMAEGIAKGIQDGLPKVIEKLTGLLDTISKELNKEENKQKMADIGSSLTASFLKGAVQFIENNGVQMLTEALNGIVKLPFEVGRRMIVNLGVGMLESIGVPKETAKKIGDTIVNVIKYFEDSMKNVGKLLVDGLVRGIRGAIPSLKDASNEIASIAAKVVKAKNKIHSPSKLFEYYGEMIDEGYIKGIEGMKGALQKATMDTFVMTPQLIGTASTNFSPVVNVNNQITNNTDPLGQTVSQIKTFANGSKNDYNYGMGV